MRGKGQSACISQHSQRITPAYAGKSRCSWEKSSSVKDHPRLCGEKFMRLFPCLTRLGSPPPMRGKASSFFLQFDKFRITPAYAGKSHRFFIVAGDNGDHPRLCGEKHSVLQRRLKLRGSPPPMRGKVFPAIQAGFGWLGITPAYAGKRNFVVKFSSANGDHPRLCGEKHFHHR